MVSNRFNVDNVDYTLNMNYPPFFLQQNDIVDDRKKENLCN